MLQCGRDWRPNSIQRFIEGFRTSTRVVKVATDIDIAFLKGLGNPQGADSLASELVSGELARWFGLTTPDFSILNVQGIELPRIECGPVEPGPAFLSREMQGFPGDGTEFALRKIRDRNSIARLVLFDTWLMNPDRYPPPDDIMLPSENRDNLFFTPIGRHFDIVALDHSHCFVTTTLADELGGNHLIEEARIYGLFPEFRPFVTEAAVQSVIAELRQIDRAMVQAIVASVPQEWGITNAQRTAWVDLIVRRAALVADFALPKLIEQICLDV